MNHDREGRPPEEDLEETQAYEAFWDREPEEGEAEWPFAGWEDEPEGAEGAQPEPPRGRGSTVGLPRLDEITFEPPDEPPSSSPTPPILAEPTVPIDRAPGAEPLSQPPVPQPVFEMRLPEPRILSKKRFRTLMLFSDALIPEGGAIRHSAGDVNVAERIDLALSRLDRSARRVLELMLTAWEWSPVLTKFRKFSKLSPRERAAFVEQSHRARSPVRRQAFQVLKIYCFNQWASTPPVEEALGYAYSCVAQEPPRDGPALEVLHYPVIDRDHTEDCDVVVVGSGAGGAVMAKELAEVGLSVIVLEEGGYFTRKDFAGPPWERFLKLYRAGGTTVALGNPTIPLPLGKAVGGTTLVNSGTCFRTPDRILREWESGHGIEGIDPPAMAPFFERVERILRVKPVPEEILGPNARVFRRGVERLGLHGQPMLRNIEGCRGCGACAFGCPSDAKQSTHISYLPRAQRAGAQIFAHARAERLVVEEGRARGVLASLTDPATGEPRAALTVRARLVVLAAGAVHTPALLAANALGGRSGQLGRNLRIHPAAGVGAFLDEDVHNWRGTLQSFFVDDYHESDDIMIEVTNSVPSVGAGTFPGAGQFAKDMIAQYPHIAACGLFVSDTSSGRVIRRRGRDPLVLYRLNQIDTRKLVRGITKVAEIFLAAGARAVVTGIPGVSMVGSRGDIDLIKEEAVKPGALKLTAFHPVGTARMGTDPGASVLDPWGRLHGVEGLFVTDASMLPGCPTVNPMITIMSFATRTADHVVRDGARYFG